MRLDQDWFADLARHCCGDVPADHRISLSLAAERSDFLRINQARTRQFTQIDQALATVSVSSDARRARKTITLSGVGELDRQRLDAAARQLQDVLPHLPEDPHLNQQHHGSSSIRDDGDGEFPAPADVAKLLDRHCAQSVQQDERDGSDLVGFYAAGPMISAYADNAGQFNWHRVASFHFDFSLIAHTPPGAPARAVKQSYAGREWSEDELIRRIESARQNLALLGRPGRQLEPGDYRVYLAPMAVADLLSGMAWSGFSRKERATGTSSLVRVAAGTESLSPVFTLIEDIAAGTAPAFTSNGEPRPGQVPLVDKGRLADCLVSPRSAVEFGETSNADQGEYPQSLSMAGGRLKQREILSQLGTGIYVANLWYLNYSDRQAARMTGMTRFACFWVENGEIQGPIEAMRFDDSLIRLFGSAVEAIDEDVEFLPSNDTWGARSLSSVRCPGVLLSALRLTL